MQRQETFAVIFATLLASAATFVLALLPAWMPVPQGPHDGLRMVQLPRVIISAPRSARVAELPRVLIEARRVPASAVLAAGGAAAGPSPVMAPQRR